MAKEDKIQTTKINDETKDQKEEKQKQEEEKQKQEKVDEEIKARVKKLWKKPKGMILIPLGMFFIFAAVFFLSAIFYAAIIFLALAAIDLVAIYYGYVIIAETQCPMYEYWGNKKGVLPSDNHLIDIFGIKVINIGGLNILLPGIEKIRKIPGFDYIKIRTKKPDAMEPKEDIEVPGPDYYIVHTRMVDIPLFSTRERIEFASSTEGWVEMFATVRATDPDRVSYSGTDVLIKQVPRILEKAAWDIFLTTDLNTLIGIPGKQVGKEIVKRREAITEEIIRNVDLVKLKRFGFCVSHYVIVDIGLSQETIDSRRDLQKKKVESLALDTQMEIEGKNVLKEELLAQQEKIRGDGINRRWKAMTAGGENGVSGMNIREAALWEVEKTKYGKGVNNLTIFETDDKENKDIAKKGGVFGSAFFSNFPQSQKVEKEEPPTQETEENKETEKNKETKKAKETKETKEGGK